MDTVITQTLIAA